MYRLTLLILWQMPGLLTERFMLLEILFVSMLLVHSVFQPYKKRWHSILDSFIFFVLSVIIVESLYTTTITSRLIFWIKLAPML